MRQSKHVLSQPKPVPQALIDQIIRNALRDAALAPTDASALDITGTALVAVAYLVNRNEVNHG